MTDPIVEAVRARMEERLRPKPFQPGVTPVPYSGTVAGGEEFAAAAEVLLSGWFGVGKWSAKFEKGVAARFGRKRGVFVNSGSSANLVALTTLTSRKLKDRLQPGDEVVTAVCGFPTTVNPILQNGLRPTFVDASLPTYNPPDEALKAAIGPKTRAIALAHTLGNPADLDLLTDLGRDHDLWLVEDCCDALGSTWKGRPAGSFGDLTTCSFYPAHHITTGEGGMVVGDDALLLRVAESVRDWGRDCWCPPGEDNTCGKRFGWKLGELPEGYDHKYVYSEVGYNLKPLELQAAIGAKQLERLDAFVAARKENFRILTERLRGVRDLLVLPEATPGADPAWFAYPVTLVDGIDRRLVVAELEKRRIATRALFGTNLLRQPAYTPLGLGDPAAFPVADRVMRSTFFVGTSPVVTPEMAAYVGESLAEIVATFAPR